MLAAIRARRVLVTLWRYGATEAQGRQGKRSRLARLRRGATEEERQGEAGEHAIERSGQDERGQCVVEAAGVAAEALDGVRCARQDGNESESGAPGKGAGRDPDAAAAQRCAQTAERDPLGDTERQTHGGADDGEHGVTLPRRGPEETEASGIQGGTKPGGELGSAPRSD